MWKWKKKLSGKYVFYVLLFNTAPWTAACQDSLSFTTSWSLLKLVPTETVIPPNHLILCRPLSSLPLIFPSIKERFGWFFASGGQSIGASTSASVLLMYIQDWFPLGLTDLISLQSKRLSSVFRLKLKKVGKPTRPFKYDLNQIPYTYTVFYV